MAQGRMVRSLCGDHTEQRLRIAMGTWVAIEATHERPSALLPAIDAAFAAVLEIERLMHPSRAGSDVARINAGAIGKPVELHPYTWEVLMLARKINERSKGTFDPCLPLRPGRIADIAPAAPRQVKCRVPIALDLGGIAKGYAVDRAIAALCAHRCHAGLVNAGGDVRVFGSPGQRIALRLGAPRRIESVHLQDQSLAAAEVQAIGRPPEHQGYYDRVSGETPRFSSAAVMAPEAAMADALVKCALLCDPDLSEEMLDAFGARLISRS